MIIYPILTGALKRNFRLLLENIENKNIIEQNGARHDIAMIAAYLIGVSDKFFDDRPDLFDKKIIKRLSLEKRARVVRNLCMIRTAMFRYNYAIYTQMTQEKKGLYGQDPGRA